MEYPKILIVSQDRLFGEHLEHMLEEFGYSSAFFWFLGLKGARKIAAKKPDIIFLDLGGLNRAEALKTADILRDRFTIPIIFLVDHMDDELRKKANISDRFEFLLKPISERKVYAAVELMRYRQSRVVDIERRFQRYFNVLNSIVDAIFVLDSSGTIQFMNSTADLLINCQFDQIKGKKYTDTFVFVNGESQTRIDVLTKKSLSTDSQTLFGQSTILELIQSGRKIPVQISHSAFIGGSALESGIVLIIRDVSDQRRTMDELLRLKAAIEQAADCILITSPNGTVQYVNPAFIKESGYSKNEILEPNFKFFYINQANLMSYRNMFHSIKQGKIWKGQLIGRKSDNSEYEMELTVSPITRGSSELKYFIFISRDITEEKRLEAIANEINLMENIDYFFSGIRHELGNPMNSIKMTLSVLRKNLESFNKSKIKEYINRSHKEISRVENLLKSLKSFNMYETLSPEYVSLPKFLNDFLALVKPECEAKGIVLNLSIANEKIAAYVDPRALQQVFLNITTNAVDAVHKKKKPHITISLSQKAQAIIIQFVDNGIGFPKGQQKNLFKPFYTTKGEGTGLGLIITKKLLSKMGGTITIESSEKNETKVTISLPTDDQFNLQRLKKET